MLPLRGIVEEASRGMQRPTICNDFRHINAQPPDQPRAVIPSHAVQTANVGGAIGFDTSPGKEEPLGGSGVAREIVVKAYNNTPLAQGSESADLQPVEPKGPGISSTPNTENAVKSDLEEFPSPGTSRSSTATYPASSFSPVSGSNQSVASSSQTTPEGSPSNSCFSLMGDSEPADFHWDDFDFGFDIIPGSELAEMLGGAGIRF